jgi:hypothetical protein
LSSFTIMIPMDEDPGAIQAFHCALPGSWYDGIAIRLCATPELLARREMNSAHSVIRSQIALFMLSLHVEIGAINLVERSIQKQKRKAIIQEIDSKRIFIGLWNLLVNKPLAVWSSTKCLGR